MLDYAGKQSLIAYFGDRTKWVNLYDEAFFLDQTRKTPMRKHGKFLETVIRVNNTPDQVILKHSGTRAQFIITTDNKGTIHVTDERGVTVTSEQDHQEKITKGRLTGPFANVANDGHNLKKPSPDEIEIERYGLTIKVYNTGDKEITFGHQGTAASLTALPKDAETENHAPDTGKLLHRLTIPRSFIENISLPFSDCPRYLALLLARDFDLESELAALNLINQSASTEAADEALMDRYDPEWDGPEAWRPKLPVDTSGEKIVEVPWHDVTEFRGYKVGTPTTFRIAKEEDAFAIKTQFDQRNRILSYAGIFRTVTETAPKSTSFISQETTPEALVRLLSDGHELVVKNSDPTSKNEGDAWSYCVVKRSDAAKVANSIRERVKSAYGLNGNDFAAVHFDRNSSFIAIRQDSLEECLVRGNTDSHTKNQLGAPVPDQ